jgi:hypothetical protein
VTKNLSSLAVMLKELYNSHSTPVVEEKDGKVIFTFSEYNDNLWGVNFNRLMAISDILGTTDFDVKSAHTEGTVYSEYTVDPDTYYTIIEVKKELL